MLYYLAKVFHQDDSMFKLEFILKNSKKKYKEQGKAYCRSVKQKFEVDILDYIVTQSARSERTDSSVVQTIHVTVLATIPFKVKVTTTSSDTQAKTKHVRKEVLTSMDEATLGSKSLCHILTAE
jgi:hypothetical protein